MAFPQMLRIRQQFHAPQIDDVPGEVERQLSTLDLGEKIKPGETVAITAGSRGIANIAEIIKAFLKNSDWLTRGTATVSPLPWPTPGPAELGFTLSRAIYLSVTAVVIAVIMLAD